MKINKVYVGSWYPRTMFHLNELYEFLSEGTSHLSLDPNKVKDLKASLDPKEVVLEQTSGEKIVHAKFDKYDFEGRESGLYLFSCCCIESDKVTEEMENLSNLAFKKVFSSFNYLYSLGAPIPKVFSAMKSVMPYVFTVSNIAKGEVELFLEEHNQKIIKKFKNKDIEIYYGKTIIIINGDPKLAEEIINEAIYYIHDAESQFQRILDLHRFIWDEVTQIKLSNKIKYKDLAATRDLIMEIDSEVIFFKSRIDQIEKILKVQLSKIDDKNIDSVWGNIRMGFNSVIDSGDYIKSLWEMTNNYLNSATELVSLVYAESSKKQINALQFIFVISAVASVMALGSIGGFNLSILDNSGVQLLEGEAISFSILYFFKMAGIALLTGTGVYILWNYLYRYFAGTKISNPSLVSSKEFERIKKMLN